MPEINSHNPAATFGPVLSLHRNSAVSQLPDLLKIATPTGYGDSGPIYPTDISGARMVADWLNDAAVSLLHGQEAIGFLLSGLDRDIVASNPVELVKLGEVLNLLAVMIHAAHDGAASLHGYADQLVREE